MRCQTLIACLLVCLPAFSHAENMIFDASYVYDAGESDSKLTCRAVSLQEVKKLLLEKIGVYLETKTEVVN
ncbi:MAG: hypothetical protein ACOZF0_09620 [Thermodesulfobacteriota bacterium]